MKLSARNQLPGTVVEVSQGAVNGIVKIEVAPGVIITSSITNAAIEELGAEHGFHVDHTEDAEDFTEQNLGHYDVVVWLSTTGDVLNEEQQAAFEGYIQDGGGYAGVHAASDTEYDWPWYGELVGAYFDSHPQIQEATTVVTDHVHPSTAHLDEEWVRTDEWYNFQDNPRGDVHVLAALDEDSYDAGSGAMGHDHPIAWCQEFDGGRSWSTGGLRTAAGVAEADCKATVDSSFDQVTLAKGADQAGEPIALAVLPDRSVLHTARDGRVFHTTADGLNTLAARIPVYDHDEDGTPGRWLEMVRHTLKSLGPKVLALVENGDPVPLRTWLVDSGIRPEKPVRLV